jgi:hypothetical protein
VTISVVRGRLACAASISPATRAALAGSSPVVGSS